MPDSLATDSQLADLWLNRRTLLEGIFTGVAYGLVLRGFQIALNATHRIQWLLHVDIVMTLAFLISGPLVIGLLSIRRAESQEAGSIWQWIFVPWIAVILMMAVTALLNWEGAICIAMALPIALLFSSIGGVAGGFAARSKRLSSQSTMCIAVLPFLIAPLESSLTPPIQTRTVSSSIRIHAPADVVWQNIERVPAISPSELRPNWTHRIGFPRPVEATLSFEGVGGVRHASFERGLTFIETVTAWEPGHRLAFTIKADSAHIPTTTLDEHVTIGGRYFDVLDGEYRIEQLPGGDILLHLVSHQRLSTGFNGYAGLWTDGVMQNLQSNILHVIQHRCETAPGATKPLNY